MDQDPDVKGWGLRQHQAPASSDVGPGSRDQAPHCHSGPLGYRFSNQSPSFDSAPAPILLGQDPF